MPQTSRRILYNETSLEHFELILQACARKARDSRANNFHSFETNRFASDRIRRQIFSEITTKKKNPCQRRSTGEIAKTLPATDSEVLRSSELLEEAFGSLAGRQNLAASSSDSTDSALESAPVKRPSRPPVYSG